MGYPLAELFEAETPCLEHTGGVLLFGLKKISGLGADALGLIAVARSPIRRRVKFILAPGSARISSPRNSVRLSAAPKKGVIQTQAEPHCQNDALSTLAIALIRLRPS